MKRVINGKTYSKVLGIKHGSLLTAGKDGDIEEYKADPADAGKVLTVGEGGGIIPMEGEVAKLYRHTATITLNARGDVTSEWYSFTFITSESNPFHVDESASSSDKIAVYRDLATKVSKGKQYICPCIGGIVYTDDTQDALLNVVINSGGVTAHMITVDGIPAQRALASTFIRSIDDNVVEL